MAVSGARSDAIIDLIASDERPTFILDQPPRTCGPARIVFRNTALDTFVNALRKDSPSFKTWIDTVCQASPMPSVDERARHVGVFGGQDWSGRTLGCGQTVVYCRKQDWTTSAHKDTAAPPKAAFWSGQSVYGSITTPLTDMLADWTRYEHIGSAPWITYLRSYDWENTDLGPMDAWHPVLRSHVVNIMACSEARYVLWGDDMKMLYNEAAIPWLGKLHPLCLGQPLPRIWGNGLFEQYSSTLRKCVQDGQASPTKEAELISDWDGVLNETYHNHQLTPLTMEDGRYGGALIEYAEVTSTVYQKGRRKVIAAIQESLSTTETLSDLWTRSLTALETHSEDFMYGIVYNVDNQVSVDPGSSTEQEPETYFRFQASFGIESEPFLEGPPPGLAESFTNTQDLTVLLQTSLGTLPPELAITVSRGVVCSANVFPVTSSVGAKIAYVVLGMNPRRLPTESKLFVTELRDLFTRSVSLVSLPEDRLLMEKANLALLDQLRLTKVKEEKNAQAFERMGKKAPVGWFIFAADGQPLYVNDAYLAIFELTREEFHALAKTEFVWGRSLYEEDHQSAIDLMTRVFTGKENATFEYRLKTRPGAMQRWMEGTIFSELDDQGDAVSFQGWVSDVSHRKYSESVKEERLQEALDHKKAAERFLDMISHEIRNPISSILLLAEEILTTLPRRADASLILSAENIALMVDAAETVSLCALHQKNIVDQVLAFSKLDSNLLVLVMERSHPLKIINSTLKLVTSNLAEADIKTSVQLLPSYNELELSDVLMDSNRITQVVVNLLNNAIKFTRESSVRNITVVVGASKMRPSEGMLPVDLVPRRSKQAATLPSALVIAPDTPETAQEVYLHFSVQDTGCGLSESEVGNLFNRFTQASPRTHRQYGGSGLGLTISKELVELHGGQIGVESNQGVGSTFMFYIKAYRAEPAPLPIEAVQPSQDPRLPSPTAATTLTLPIVGDRGIINSVPDMHVLLVEDNPVNQKVTARQLRKAGCKTVQVAEHGLEALDFLATSTFSKSPGSSQQPLTIVLLDVEMPVMDGRTCIRRIRELETSGDLVRHVPVIAITANARQQQIDDVIEAGMDEVQVLPISFCHLEFC
ncbi:hypothetical protein E4T47_04954 [Aureobasidium subglaciale]|nr:hypothetical protein E4T47_04954 [Aureobasidium subglaciale]